MSRRRVAMSRSGLAGRIFAFLAVCYFVCTGPRACADDAAMQKKTYTYKTVGDTNIQADVYRPDDAKSRPVVVWIHGGALIVGNRNSVPQDILNLCRKQGYVLISLDYRLAPEVKLPAIIEDLRDAFRWIHDKGPELFH